MALEKRQLVILAVAGALAIGVGVQYFPSSRADGESVESLAHIAATAPPEKAANAVLAMGRTRAANAVQQLSGYVSDARPAIREAAIYGLASVQAPLPPETTQQVLQIINQPQESDAVRIAAMNFARRAAQREAAPVLLGALEDNSPAIRSEANANLTTMLGRDYLFRAQDTPEKRAAAIARMRPALDAYVRARSDAAAPK